MIDTNVAKSSGGIRGEVEIEELGRGNVGIN